MCLSLSKELDSVSSGQWSPFVYWKVIMYMPCSTIFLYHVKWRRMYKKKRVQMWSWFQELLNFPVSFLLLKFPACLRKTPWLLCYEWLFNTWYILKWWKWVIVLKLNNLIVRHLFFLRSYILGWYCSFLLWKASDILQASEHLPVGCRISMST